MKLNIQLECNCTKENVTDIFKILDEEIQPFPSLSLRCTAISAPVH